MIYLITASLCLFIITILMYIRMINLKRETIELSKRNNKFEMKDSKIREEGLNKGSEGDLEESNTHVDLYQKRSYVGDYGELKAEEWLVEILDDLKEKELIKRYEILNNIVFRDNEDVFKIQLDHVVLTDKGIFLIETKAWSGDIYFQSSVEELVEKLPDFYFSKSDLLKLFDEKYPVVAQVKEYIETNKKYKKISVTTEKKIRNCNNFKYQVQQQATYLLQNYFKEDTESMKLWINGIVLFCNDNVRYLSDKTEEVYSIKNIRKSKLTLMVCTGKFELEMYLKDKINRINVYISDSRLNDLYDYLKKYEVRKSEGNE